MHGASIERLFWIVAWTVCPRDLLPRGRKGLGWAIPGISGGAVICSEKAMEGFFWQTHPRFGEDYRLRLADGVGDQALLVQAVHRISIERFPGPRARPRIVVMDAEVE